MEFLREFVGIPNEVELISRVEVKNFFLEIEKSVVLKSRQMV